MYCYSYTVHECLLQLLTWLQARKLCLKIFSTMDVKDFKTKVFPELCRQFPHIIPSKFCSHKQERGRVMCEESSFCLRHDIMLRSRPSTMAEMLYHRGCLSLEAYKYADYLTLSFVIIFALRIAYFLCRIWEYYPHGKFRLISLGKARRDSWLILPSLPLPG